MHTRSQHSVVLSPDGHSKTCLETRLSIIHIHNSILTFIEGEHVMKINIIIHYNELVRNDHV